MAGLGKKTFQQFDILTAADVNGYLMDQTVMRFASASARDAAIPSPTESMVCYLDDVNWVMVYTGSAWTITGGDKPHFNGTISAYSLANNSTVSIPFTTGFNRTGFINTSGVITLPQSGVYSVTAYLNFAANATGRRFIYLDHSTAGNIGGSNMLVTASTDNAFLAVAGQQYMNSGSTISLKAYQASGIALSTTGIITINYLGS